MCSQRARLLWGATVLLWATAAPAQMPMVTELRPVPTSGDEPAAYARLVEMQVALGWLADPLIFPHPLRARVHDGVLQVQGMVPDDTTRDRVVAVAHACGKIRVEDQLGRCPQDMPVPGTDTRRLSAAIQHCFKEDWAKSVHELSIQADGLGVISVGGAVPSMEEKLSISQRLSQLPGCHAVRNEVQVWQVERQGAPLVLVSADGQQTVPLQAFNSGMRMVRTTAFIAGQPQVATPTPVVAAAPLAAPTTRNMVVAHSPSFFERVKNLWRPSAPLYVTEGGLTHYASLAEASEPKVVGAPNPELMRRATIVSRELPAARPQEWVCEQRTRCFAPKQSLRERIRAYWQLRDTCGTRWSHCTHCGHAHPQVLLAAADGTGQPMPSAVETRRVPTPLALPATLPPQATPQRTFPSVPPVATTQPTAVQHMVYCPAPNGPDSGTPQRVMVATGQSTPAATTAHRPAVGQVEPASVPARTGSAVEQQLEQIIGRLCGTAARDIEVQQRGENVLQVSLKVSDQQTAHKLAADLLNQPELSSWRVFLKIQVQ